MSIIIRVCALALPVVLFGCAPNPAEPPPHSASPPILADLPLTLTVSQRSTTDVPRTDGRLRLTLGDVTRGQVDVSLVAKEGGPILAPVSLRRGDSADFQVNGRSYRLTLTELRNVLVGDDSATVRISETTAYSSESPTEIERIERLIEDIAGLEGAVFIRNGREHTAEEAADHLRSKWRAAGARIETAEQFVEELASRSSTTGRPYEIRLRDRVVVPAGEYLRERLREIERRH